MRTRSVLTNHTCNHACTFCTIRRPADDPAEISHAAVKQRITEAGAVEELVITGGEPTMRRDLAALVKHARASGARSIVLETNASLLDPPRVAALREAGVDVVRVHVPGFGETLAHITRDDDAPAALERGLAALEGMKLEVAIPIVRSNVDSVAQIPERLPRSVRTILVRVPTASPDERELLSYEEASVGIVALAEAARRVGIAIKLAADSGPPPCVFPAARRPSHLYSLSGKPTAHPDYAQIEACSDCRMRESCRGFARSYLQRFGVPKVTPIVDDRARRRLSLIHTVEEQVAREMVAPGGRARDGTEERIIRVSFHCNQACDFCFVSTHLPPPREDAVVSAIEAALAENVRIVVSGGEPTLHPRLVEYLRLATKSPFPVELQTNAVRLEDASLARAVVETGLGRAFVSLHGATAETSDRVTRAPGTFEKTLRGVDNLHALGLEIRLNFVICASNASELPAMIELVATRWPGASVVVSFVAQSTDVVPRDRELMPRYSEVLPFVGEALQRGSARGVEIGG
ncbi:MAG: radical SAM protein, partial [Polyangiales bacterium]